MKKFYLIIFVLVFLVGCDRNAYLQFDGNSLIYNKVYVGKLSENHCQHLKYTDEIEKLDTNFVKVTRLYEALQDIDSVRLTLDFLHASKCDYVMIPSVCYNGNHWGRGNEPKGFQTDGVWHTYSYRRTPIPGATYSEGQRFAVAMWGDLPMNDDDAFSCAIMPDSSHVIHSLILPEEERPFTYIDKNVYGGEFVKKLSMHKGEKKKLVSYIYVVDKLINSQPMALVMDKAWERADKQFAKAFPSDKIWEYVVRFVKESLWAEEPGYKGFSIGLVPDGEKGWKQRPFVKYEIGWCGQNSSLINSLLVDYLNTGNEESQRKALSALQTWTVPELCRDNGFYVVNYDNLLNHRKNIVSDACNLGTAAYNFFETIDLLEKCNLSSYIPQVKEIALGICDFVRNDQQSSGVYGKGWNEFGECLYRDGTVGSFMIAPMLSAYKLTNDERYLNSALKAFDYYYDDFVQKGYTTAGALDTWCIDKESSMPMLRASLLMYDITGDFSYVEKAEAISQYLSTWLWHYKANYADKTNGETFEYNTFGATSVSVQHHHLDVYALLWVSEWMRLAELTGKRVWHEKAMAIWKNGCQLISDGTLEINGKNRPVGGQNEAFFHCRWGFDEASDKSRINNWLVAWPGAFCLETLRKLTDWKMLDVDVN